MCAEYSCVNLKFIFTSFSLELYYFDKKWFICYYHIVASAYKRLFIFDYAWFYIDIEFLVVDKTKFASTLIMLFWLFKKKVATLEI